MDALRIVGHKKLKLRTGRNNQGIEGYGGGPLWRRRPSLSWSANKEEEEYVECYIKYPSWTIWTKVHEDKLLFG